MQEKKETWNTLMIIESDTKEEQEPPEFSNHTLRQHTTPQQQHTTPYIHTYIHT
jgi:hypothetical protein